MGELVHDIKDEIVDFVISSTIFDISWEEKMTDLMKKYGAPKVHNAYVLGVKSGELSEKAIYNLEYLIDDLLFHKKEDI